MKKIVLILSILCFSLTSYAQQKEIEVSAKTLKTYVGKYEVAPNVMADITTDEKHMFLQLTGQQKFEFIAIEKHTFYFNGLDVKVVFNPSKKKEIESLTIYQDGQTVTAKKIAYTEQKEIEVSAKTLKTYVGKYEVAPNLIADVTTDEKHIFIQLTGQEKLEFIAIEKHTFYFKERDAKVVFNPNKKRKIESLTIYQNGQTVPAKRIK